MATGTAARTQLDPPLEAAPATPDNAGREVNRMLKLFTEAQLRVAALWSKVRPEEGQTMAEYAVVLGVITIAVVVTLGLLSTAIKNLLNNVISSL